jgi:hypothetical protein
MLSRNEKIIKIIIGKLSFLQQMLRFETGREKDGAL